MSERTKLLKKALLTGVGATTNGERIKEALTDAVDDLVKIAADLMDELESRGKVKAKSAEDFIKNFRSEAVKRTDNFLGGRVTTKVSKSVQKAVKEMGLATTSDVEELCARIEALENATHKNGATAATTPRVAARNPRKQR